MLDEVIAACPHCGAPRVLLVDPANGPTQEYVEDCEVCCRPTVARVRYRRGRAAVELSPE